MFWRFGSRAGTLYASCGATLGARHGSGHVEIQFQSGHLCGTRVRTPSGFRLGLTRHGRGWRRPVLARPLHLVEGSSRFVRLSLCRPCSRPGDLKFHSVFFPTAHFLCVEEVSVIAEIARAACSVSRFVNLLTHPSLSRCDWRSTIGTFVLVADKHVLTSNKWDAVLAGKLSN